MSSFEKRWIESCQNQKIPPNIANKWLQTIQTKYNTESHRIYHNFTVLSNKSKCLHSIAAIANVSDYLIFALAFQYYHFDLKINCTEQNCQAFREFYNESGVDNVSCHLNSKENFGRFVTRF